MTGSRISRLLGLIRVGSARAVNRTLRADGSRVRISVIGVAIAIATLVLVTGIAVGLGAETTAYGSDVDYWIVPEGGGASALVNTGGAMFGDTHPTAAEINEREEVDYATPVLTRPIQLESATEQEYVLAVGVVGTEDATRIAGLPPSALSPGDPHFGEGEYDGPRTGELVGSEAAASILDVEEGSEVTIVGPEESATVVAVSDARDGPTGDVPIVLMQLSELQTITGADDGDQADQILVSSSATGLAAELETIYPQSTVETRSGLLAQNTVDQDLSLALGLTGLVTAVGIGLLFVCATMGMEVVADRRELTTMTALGISTRSQLTVIGVQTIVTTALGGIVGSLLGAIGIWVVNRGVTEVVDLGAVAIFHPVYFVYGIGVALLIGVFSLPYLFVLLARTGGVDT